MRCGGTLPSTDTINRAGAEQSDGVALPERQVRESYRKERPFVWGVIEDPHRAGMGRSDMDIRMHSRRVALTLDFCGLKTGIDGHRTLASKAGCQKNPLAPVSQVHSGRSALA